METVIQDRTPLADYLKGEPAVPFVLRIPHRVSEMMASWILTAFLLVDEGEEQQAWATPSVSENHDESPPSSPSFAPVGRPMVKKRFRTNLPHPLPLDIPRMNRLSSLRHSYSVSTLWRYHTPCQDSQRLTVGFLRNRRR